MSNHIKSINLVIKHLRYMLNYRAFSSKSLHSKLSKNFSFFFFIYLNLTEWMI
jgi:hypothetical protein